MNHPPGTSASGSAQPVRNRRLALVVTDNRFWRQALGSHARISALLAFLGREGFDVVVAFHGRPYVEDAAQAAALPGVRVCFSRPALVDKAPAAEAPRADWRQWAATARRWSRAALSPWRVSSIERETVTWADRVRLRSLEPRIGDLADPALPAFAARVLEGASPDLVLVEYLRLAWTLPALRAIWPEARFWVDTHDVMFERQARFHAAGQAHELDTSAGEEAKLLSAFDAVLAIQARDAAQLRRMGVTAPVVTVVHPVPAYLVRQAPAMPPAVGFLGSDMPPNRLALEELVFEIWPRLCPTDGQGPQLVVAGGVCAALQGRALPPGVQVLGYVAHTDDFYARVGMIACPVRMGGGLKIKVVEALCRGKAVVTTPLGAEGMEDHPPGALTVREQTHAIADALRGWLEADALLAVAQEAAFAYGHDRFAPEAAFAPLRRILLSDAK